MSSGRAVSGISLALLRPVMWFIQTHLGIVKRVNRAEIYPDHLETHSDSFKILLYPYFVKTCEVSFRRGSDSSNASWLYTETLSVIKTDLDSSRTLTARFVQILQSHSNSIKSRWGSFNLSWDFDLFECIRTWRLIQTPSTLSQIFLRLVLRFV